MKDLLSPLLMLFSSSSSPSSPTTKVQREFRFVPYGESFVDDASTNNKNRPTISCDGRIPGGVTLELTHWTGNETPDRWYADTSTEMALNLAQATTTTAVNDDADVFPNALVLNNHYDTDGVLSVWACLHPQTALRYKDLLRQGAEAGDFGEWPSDRGVKLNWIVENFHTTNDEQAYAAVLPELEQILQDVTENDGQGYKDLWQADMENALASWNDFRNGKISLARGPGKIVLVDEKAAATAPMDPHALHKALQETNLWSDTTRILQRNSNNSYRYSKIGHGWVQRLVKRPMVPPANAKAIVQALNAACGDHAVWKASGAGLTSICQSGAPTDDLTSAQVMEYLYEADPGAQ